MKKQGYQIKINISHANAQIFVVPIIREEHIA